MANEKKTLEEKLLDMQMELKAPKNQYNNFGKYAYRSAEDIVEAVKPLEKKYRAVMTINDEVVQFGTRVYIKATVILTDIDEPTKTISTSAFAREPENKKGMDDSQITGTASSYARKYALTEGAGRNRGNRSGGIDNVSRWKNCVISTGERPINSQSSGGGAVARVIEIEVKTPLFDEKTAKAIVDVITKNYGFWGRKYVKIVSEISTDELKKRYNDLSSELINRGIMDKQAQSGAIIMLANALIAEFLKNEDLKLKVDDMIPFLKTKEEVDVCKRAYGFICGKVVENQTKFAGEVERQMEIWGKFNSDDQVCIIKTKFDAICADGGISPKPLLSWLADKKLIKRDGQNQFTVPVYVGTKTTRCVVLTLPQAGNDGSNNDDILDF